MMKWIKEYNTYKEITPEDYDDLLKNREKFSEKYKSVIMNNRFDVRSPLEMIDGENGNILILPRNFSLARLSIYEIQDEYFIIRTSYHYSAEKFYQNEHYKCDQIEGLIDCIKHIYSI